MDRYYETLVRDKVPDNLRKDDGLECETMIIEPSSIDFILALMDKFKERFGAYQNSNNIDEVKNELADLLELLYSMAKYHNITIKELFDVRHEKAQRMGKYNKGIFLIRIFDEDE